MSPGGKKQKCCKIFYFTFSLKPLGATIFPAAFNSFGAGRRDYFVGFFHSLVKDTLEQRSPTTGSFGTGPDRKNKETKNDDNYIFSRE